MTVNNFDNVDMIVRNKDESISMIIIEHRDWKKINRPLVWLAIKTRLYREYAKTETFKKKHNSSKPIRIILATKHNPPVEIRKFLTKENITIHIIDLKGG